ncbi:MAG: nickel-dependent lactate racemase [Candidatus Methanomethylicia archaeon]|nr:nickel-dependent lactate racemase [Candidatus Methanomethylicia archaeon]
MLIEVPYGDEVIKCNIPDRNLIEILKLKSYWEPEPIPPLEEELMEFINNCRKLLIVVNDQERPTPTAKILKKINSVLNDEVRVIVATGAHRAPNEDELKWIFGELYGKYRGKTILHDAKKKEEHIYIGTTSRGNDIYIDKRGLEAEKIIVIGSVEPHYFAGYTGGRKFLLPGIVSYETIEYNHKFALNQNARILKLEGNPVHEDMMDALKIFNRNEDIYSIMTILNADEELAAIKSGDIIESFIESVEVANKVFVVETKGKADIILAITNKPFDISLYQAQKAIEHSKIAVKEGGIIILIAECRDGIGPRNFYDLLASQRKPEDVLEYIKSNYRLGYHKAAKMAETLLKADIWAVTSLEKEVLEKIGIRAFYNLQEAINEALKFKGGNAELKVIYDAATIVPNIK